MVKLVSCRSVTMPSRLAHAPVAEVRVRKAERGDIGALIDLEHRVFATDRLSRRSLRRFLQSPTAEVIVAEHGDGDRSAAGESDHAAQHDDRGGNAEFDER